MSRPRRSSWHSLRGQYFCAGTRGLGGNKAAQARHLFVAMADPQLGKDPRSGRQPLWAPVRTCVKPAGVKVLVLKRLNWAVQRPWLDQVRRQSFAPWPAVKGACCRQRRSAPPVELTVITESGWRREHIRRRSHGTTAFGQR